MEKDARFSSERLAYRGIAESDAELIVSWRSNPDNYRYFLSAKPISLDDHLTWFKGYLEDDTRYDFMILDGSGSPIGTCGLSHIGGGSCEVSYMIGDRAARGRGYAREAVRRLVDLAFNEFGLRSVIATVLPENEASIAVVEGVGFRESAVVYRLDRGGDV